MSTCPNCGKKLSCGCQKTKAADGKICCNGCVGSYNKALRDKTPNTKRAISSVSVNRRIIDTLDNV
jgi:hypothetical protein